MTAVTKKTEKKPTITDPKTDSKITSPELEDQLEGFECVDLDKEGLSEYREYLHSNGFRSLKNKANNSSSISSVSEANNIFEMVDRDKSGWITSEEAETILFKSHLFPMMYLTVSSAVFYNK